MERPTKRLSSAQICSLEATIAAEKEEKILDRAVNEVIAREVPAPPVKRPKPVKRTKHDIVTFVRDKLKTLEKKYHGLEALQYKIVELERERDGLKGRHTIHRKAALGRRIEELREEAHVLETRDELVDFKEHCCDFLRQFSMLEMEEKAADASAAPKPAVLHVGEKRKVTSIRRRHVAKPEMRTITGGRLSSIVAADAFLEMYDGGAKPLCLQSDEECNICGGTLAVDVQADVMVCEVCRNEQMASLLSYRNVGVGAPEYISLSTSRYRRIVHFISHIQRFEGCVGSEKITDELIRVVMTWLEEQGVPPERVTKAKVERALRKTGHSDMVVFRTVITRIITGKTPPRFTPDQRAQLISMFMLISNSFQAIMDRGEFPHRINFLSYQFVLAKMLGLLSWGGEFQNHFRLLKGKDNLSKQDSFWRAICAEAGLKYISSV